MSLPRMSLHIGDYKKDTGHLRAAGHGAYLMLIMHYWATGGLPDDDEQLASIACLTDKEWRKWKPTLQGFFQDGWRHKRIDQELAEATEKYERRVEAGRRGGQAKAANHPSNARAMLKQPITDNPKEEEEEQPSQKTHTPRAVANATRPGGESLFQEFWKAYPRRGEAANPKKPARDRFDRLVKSGADPTEIIAGARRYAEIEHRAGRAGTDKIAQAIRWLTEERWRDYRETVVLGALKVFVRVDTDQWRAWQEHLKATTGKGSPCHNDGWHFESEWPPKVPLSARASAQVH